MPADNENALAPAQEGTALAARQEPSVMQIISQVVENPNFDVEKMERLLNMQERIMAKNAEMAFTQAMSRVQSVLPVIHKDKDIVIKNIKQSSYASYEKIDSIIRPLYTPEGFSISFSTDENAKGLKIVGTLSHREGHSVSSSVTLPIDSSGSKNATQGVGSTISYGKRDIVTMMFNLVFSDDQRDDGGVSAGHARIEEWQVADLEAKITEAGVTLDSFLKFMGVAGLVDIPISDYSRGMTALNTKIQAKKGAP